MRIESRRLIHIGINFLVSHPPILNQRTQLCFQQELSARGLDFSSVEIGDSELRVARRNLPIEILVKAASAQPAIGQLLVIAPEPARPLDLFIQEVEEVVRAFEAVWPAENRQIVTSDTALRDLYETTSTHAFQEIWECRLRQDEQSLQKLGRPVLGGGLRLVMPALPGDPRSPEIEVKIESYLRDTTKLLIETQLVWRQPIAAEPGNAFDARSCLLKADAYAQQQVIDFLARS